MKKDKSEIFDLFGEIHLFVCSSGFEDRSLSLASSLERRMVKNAVLFNSSDNYTVSYDNIDKITTIINDIVVVEYPKNNSIQIFDIIYERIASFVVPGLNSRLKVVVDISTFTREVLLILIKVLSLREILSAFTIQLCYTPAESYPNEWLTKGIREIRSIFGFSGMNYPSKKLLLIILNGFETERTEEIINSFEANKILIGRPSIVDSINSELNIVSQNKFALIKEKYESIILEEFEFSCVNVLETRSILESLIEKYSKDFNVVISPLNNKISTLATAIVGLKNETVQICYASANQYNINLYSTKCDYFLIYDLNELLL